MDKNLKNSDMEDKWYFCEYDGGADIVFGRQNSKMRYEGGFYSSRSGGYSTKEELIEKCKLLDEPCRECGRLITTNFCEPTKSELIAKNLCFRCDHWDGYVKTANDPTHFRIEGSHYADAGKTSDGKYNGFGGRVFFIKKFNGETVETNNLWHQGTIPPHFRDRLPDNAEFVKIPNKVGHGEGYLGGIR